MASVEVRPSHGSVGPLAADGGPEQPLLLLACLQPGVPAFTVLQPEGPLAVLRDRAQQTSVSEWVVWWPGGGVR